VIRDSDVLELATLLGKVAVGLRTLSPAANPR
jgi:hypothetical protein